MLANPDIRKIFLKNTVTSKADNPVITFVHKLPIKLLFINIIGLLLAGLIITRFIYLNTTQSHFLTQQLDARILRNIPTEAYRGEIIDRNSQALAISTPVVSIWADPKQMNNLTSTQLKNLSSLLNMPIGELNKSLNRKNKSFVYLKRGLNPSLALEIKSLNIDGVYLLHEYKRFYPSAEVAAHVVGFTNVDDKGAEGIEYADNKLLTGTNGSQAIVRDRQGNIVDSINANNKNVENGQDIKLSIDNRIQYIAYKALKAQVNKYHAKGGSVIVLDAKSGQVLSMVNMPTYNPNNKSHVTLEQLRNRAAIDLYEPGSTMKPFIAALALNKGLVSPNTIINAKPYKLGGHMIRDVENNSLLSVTQIIEKSSDVGISKIALKFKPETLWHYDYALGFGHKLGTGFPGEAGGILLPYKRWKPLDQASMSYGYAISVSLMQMAHAYTLFTNDGCLLPVSFYAQDKPEKCIQLIKPSTATVMRKILAKVTADGTGQLAQLDDYTTAGKTGTAHKANSHGYAANQYVGSFIGYAPASNPKIIVAVMLDNPKGQYYGGVVAAPVFKSIAGQTLHLLGIQPDLVKSSLKS